MSSTMPVRVQVMCIVIVVTSPRRLSLATSLTVWRRLRQGRPSSGLGDLRPQGGRSTCRGPVAYGPVGPHRACAVADLKGSLISTRDVWALPLRTFGRWPRTDARIRCRRRAAGPDWSKEKTMRRRAFDLLLSSTGMVLTIVLLVAGGLLYWGYSFANSNVHDQLAAQKILFPPKGSQALAPPEIGRYLNQYACQQLVNRAQAQAYANHFVAVHLKEAAGGKTYAQVSSLALQNPNDAKLAGQVQPYSGVRPCGGCC